MKKKANQRAIGQSNAFNRRRRAVQILACLLAVHLATITFAATPPSTNLGLPGIFDIDQRQSDNSITQTISYLSGVETTDPDKWRQFQIYLNSPGVPQADVSNYLDKIKLATSLLKQGDIATARRIVIGLSQYSEIDKSLSEELGKKVDAYYEIQQLKSKIETSNAQLKVALQTPQKTPDQISDDIRHMAQEQEDQRNNRDNSQIPESAPISPDPTTGQSQTVALPLTGQVPAPEMTQDYLRTLQIQEQIDANKAANAKLLSENQQDFELYIKQLFTDGHYRHVVLAATFYQALYQPPPGQSLPEVGQALEIDRDLTQAISEIPDDEKNGQLFRALRALYVSYNLSSFDPETLGISLTTKAPLARLLKLLLQLQNALEVQSLPDIENVLTRIRPLALDLNVKPIEETLKVIRHQSLFDLTQGKFELTRGKTDEALKDFQKAEKEWPENPALLGGASRVFDAEVAKNRDLAQFDELYQMRAFGSIEATAAKFNQDVQDDTDRKSKLDYAIDCWREANVARQTAQLLRTRGNYAGAWEALQPALSAWPEDDKLKTFQDDLALKAAPFVEAIQKAQEAERNNAWGYSLSWYAVAQHDYPASSIARGSIMRLVSEPVSK